MAERACRTCNRPYIVPEGKSDPGYCSDRCFSASHTEEGASRLGWFFKFMVLVGLIALAVFRVDAAVWTTHNVPPIAPYTCAFLAWNGGDGTDRLIAMLFESDTVARGAALTALQSPGDPADARAHVTARLEDLRKQSLKLTRPEAAQLLLVLGKCKVVEAIDDANTGLEIEEMQLAAIQTLGYLGDGKAETTLIDLLNDAEFKFKNKPDRLAAVVWALSQLPDRMRERTSRYFPYLSHESAVVRAAAADAIATEGFDYQELKNKLTPASAMDQYELKNMLARLDKGLAAVQAAGPAEKEPGARAAMAEAVAKMVGTRPDWAN